MDRLEEVFRALKRISGLAVSRSEPLARHTRFALGGPAGIFAEAKCAEAYTGAFEQAKASGVPFVVVGGGTNLVVSDDGFSGLVLRFTGSRIESRGGSVRAEAGAVLQDLVDYTVDRRLKGLETLAGIPGSVGGAVYGNAGAYGHAISERVTSVRFFDQAAAREIGNSDCQFSYRESVFKRNKDWVIFETEMALTPAPDEDLRAVADRITNTRNEKFPPEMKCAGSIFKNLHVVELPAAVAATVPPEVVREGKIPAAWFLDRAGAKGMARGDIRVAPYHANLIYNAGSGTARELRALIAELKARVHAQFGFDLEEEVQYVGFDGSAP